MKLVEVVLGVEVLMTTATIYVDWDCKFMMIVVTMMSVACYLSYLA
jgi:hypothetical protein